MMNVLVTSNGVWPTRAQQWTRNVPNWSIVSTQQRGDIVSDGSHCGIATSSSTVLGALRNNVNSNYNFSGSTIQRYNGS